MPLNRRNILKGVGATAIGGSAILGSGALTQISSARTVSVNVSNDSSSTIALSPGTEVDGIGTIEENSDGQLTFTLSDINADSQLVIGNAPSADPSTQTISSTAFEITDNADWGSNNDLATAIDVSISSSTSGSGLGLIFLPTSNTDDLANFNATGYTDSDQDSVAGANLSSAGTDIVSLPSRYQKSGSPDADSARFLLDNESTVGAELLLQADAADLNSNPSFDITITAQPVSAPPELMTSLSDRKGNAVGDTNFGNFDPRANSGTAFLTATNDSPFDVSASASDTDVSIGGATTISSGGTSEDITLDHTQTADQSTNVSLSSTSDSDTYGPINVPVAPSSAVSRWTLNSGDTSSSTATDVWGGNDLSIDGGVATGEPGPSQTYNAGEAYNFDAGEKLSASNPSVPTGSSPRTVAFWVNLDSFNDGATTVGYGKDSTSNGTFDLRVYDNGTIKFVGFNNDDGEISVSTGQWYHVTCTYDGNTGISLYRNGPDSDNTPTATGTVNQLDTVNDVLKVGGSIDESLDQLDGQISDVRIYDKELTGAEVDSLYHTGSII